MSKPTLVSRCNSNVARLVNLILLFTGCITSTSQQQTKDISRICREDRTVHITINFFSQEILPHHNHHHHRLMDNGKLQVDFSDEAAQGTYQCMAESPVGEVMGRRISVRSKRQHVPARFLQHISAGDGVAS